MNIVDYISCHAKFYVRNILLLKRTTVSGSIFFVTTQLFYKVFFADQTFAYIGNYMFSYVYKLGEALRKQLNIRIK